VSGSGISWAICKSAPCSRQITIPAPHHSVFYRPDALPAAQPTVSKHWRQQKQVANIHKYSSRHVTNRKQVCVQLLRMLTTWHCPHLSAAVCHAAKFAAMAHAGTDRRTDPAVHTRWAVPTNRHSILQVFLITFSLTTVKNWVVGCWHGYLSGAMCRFAYGPADATATHCLLLQ